MPSTKLLKILLFIFIAFALGEIVFTIQRYGFPKIDLFKPKPGSCKILEGKYCNQSKIIESKNITYIGFELPLEAIVFSPVDGRGSTAKISQPAPTQGTLLSVYPPDRSIEYHFIGDIKLPDKIEVQRGKVIGSIENTGVKNFGAYNLIFTITHVDSITKETIIDKDILKKWFPRAK